MTSRGTSSASDCGPVMSMEIFFPDLKRLWLLSISSLFYNMWYCRGELFFLWDQIQGTISSLLPNNAKLLKNMLLTGQNSSLWQNNALKIDFLVWYISNFRTSYEPSCTFFPICISAFQINGLPNKTSQYFYFHMRFFFLFPPLWPLTKYILHPSAVTNVVLCHSWTDPIYFFFFWSSHKVVRVNDLIFFSLLPWLIGSCRVD